MTAIEIPARPIPKVALGRETMEKLKFYIDGAWVDPATPSTLGIVNPATEETFAQISLGSRLDVDRGRQGSAPRFRDLFRNQRRTTPVLACEDHRGV